MLVGIAGVGVGGAAVRGAGERGAGGLLGPGEAACLVVVWASKTGQADLPYFERFAKWFEESHPGTKVDLVLPPGEGAYEAKLITMFAGGTYPDVFHLHFSRLREFWAKGLLAPFDAYLKAGRFPMEDFIPGVLVPFRIGRADLGGCPGTTPPA